MAAAQHAPVRSRTFPGWKIEAPHLDSRMVRRPRLSAKLDGFLHGRPVADVCLVTAPAGYGKTTALAFWAETADMPVVWYHADASDGDPAAFIYGLIRTLRTVVPRGQWQVKSLLEGLHSGALSPLDLRRAAEVFAADLRSHVARPTALIITGLDALSDAPTSRALLEHLLTRPPDHLRLVLESREVPTLRVSTLLAQRRLEGIGLDDLAFTHDELAELVARQGIAADAGYLERLHGLCDGWVTGALLATGSLWPESLVGRAGEEMDRAAVFGYLASEILDRLPPELYDFAAHAAVLSYMTEPLCRDLLNAPDARERLAALERRTGFVSHIGRRPQEPVYRFQPLLRQALLDHLGQLRSPDELRALHRKAADLLAAHGDDEEAVQHYLLAEDVDALIELIEARREGLLRSGRGETLARWIALLPAGAPAAHLPLQTLLAEVHRIAGRTDEAQAVIAEVCRHLLSSASAHPLVAARALLVRADLRYVRGEYAEAQRDCEDALALLPDEAGEADELHVQASFVLAACMNMLSGPAAARACLEGVEERCHRQRDLWALARLHYLRSTLALTQGAMLDAEASAVTGLRFAQEAGDEVRAIVCLLNLGGARQYLGRVNEARADLDSALKRARVAGHVQAEAYAVVNLADLELNARRYAEAIALYAEAAEIERRIADQHLRICIAANKTYALAASGSAEEAVRELAPILAEHSELQPGPDWARVHVSLGYARYRLGDLAGAEAALAQVSAVSCRQGELSECARAKVTSAAVQLALGDTARALAELDAAFRLAEQIDGTASPLMDTRHLPELAPLLERSAHPLAASLRAMLAPKAVPTSTAATASAQSAPMDVEEQVNGEPFHVYALGELRVRQGSKLVRGWRRPRTRELLLFLLDRKTPVRGDLILEAIWPDKEPETAEAEFRKTRSDLKSALGRPCLEQQHGRWSLTGEWWVDVREFERLVAEGEELAAHDDAQAAADRLRLALALWGGPYLDDFTSDWAILRREDLHRRRLDALELLATMEMRLRRFDAAAEYCRQLIEAEPYRETAHRGLMACYSARGEFAKALAQYARCAAILRDELGAAPSPQTQSLRASIQARLREDRPAPAAVAP